MTTNFIGTYRTTVPILLLLLTGCASIPDDLGRSDVDQLIEDRGLITSKSELSFDSEFIETLTRSELTADVAVRIALNNNPKLKSTYAQLGLAAADVYEASRIRNPIFSASFLDSNQSGERDQITYGLLASFTDLITLPSRKKLARQEFAITKQFVGAEVLAAAIDTERAFYEFVAAKQMMAMRAQIAEASRLSADLAARYYDAGNLTPRELALERAAASEAQMLALEAEANAFAARTNLALQMGLASMDAWDAAPQLPAPLPQEDNLEELLTLAYDSRLDLAAAQAKADMLADRYGYTRWSRWVGELDVGYERERETDGAKLRGPTVEWEVPVFTQKNDQLLRADVNFKIAVNEIERLQNEIQNQVQLAFKETMNAKARVAEFRDRLIPARVEAVKRAQEEESFMLIGIFELLSDKQQEYDAYQGYLESVRDYWLARTELTRAVGTTLPSSAHVGDTYLNVKQYLPKEEQQEKSTAKNHMHHHMDMDSDSDHSSDEINEPQPESPPSHQH